MKTQMKKSRKKFCEVFLKEKSDGELLEMIVVADHNDQISQAIADRIQKVLFTRSDGFSTPFGK